MTMGMIAALGAGVMYGTMYIPYRKAYISGLNPLSFVTIFTFSEVFTVSVLGSFYHGGACNLIGELQRAQSMLFWPFLGGVCWVIGDLFQQYAAKYIGIGRGIPLSNTNQLWGLAWGVLVFGELGGLGLLSKGLVVFGSVLMILGAVSISMADPGPLELENWKHTVNRECERYGMNLEAVTAIVHGEDPLADKPRTRHWWELAIVCFAVGIFAWLGLSTRIQHIAISLPWMLVLMLATVVPLAVCGTMLWRRTRFS
jgi:drug/metabolite transporter (DMT)-like permease